MELQISPSKYYQRDSDVFLNASVLLKFVSRSLDYMAVTMHQKNIFPTIRSIREDLQQQIRDVKNVLAQLENTDAELKNLESHEPNQ